MSTNTLPSYPLPSHTLTTHDASRPTLSGRILSTTKMKRSTSVLAAALLLALTACGADSADSAGSTADNGATDTASQPDIDGTYSVEWTVEELTEALGGESNGEAARLAEINAGTVRVILDDGVFDMVGIDTRGSEASCPGTYVVEGDRIVMTATSDPTKWACGSDSLGTTVADARWSLDGDTLTFTDWNLPNGPGMIHFSSVYLGTKPLERVAG